MTVNFQKIGFIEAVTFVRFEAPYLGKSKA